MSKPQLHNWTLILYYWATNNTIFLTWSPTNNYLSAWTICQCSCNMRKTKNENWEPRKDKNPSNFPTKNMLIYNSMHPKELIFDKSILFFRLCTYLAQWVESFSEEAFLNEKNENWEPRKDKNPSNFPQKTCLQIHYLQFYASRSINFWKRHPIIQVWCSSISRLNFFLKEHFCFCSPLVSYLHKKDS